MGVRDRKCTAVAIMFLAYAWKERRKHTLRTRARELLSLVAALRHDFAGGRRPAGGTWPFLVGPSLGGPAGWSIIGCLGFATPA